MPDESDLETLRIVEEWCAAKSAEWRVGSQLGTGGTAPVYEILTPEGSRALKLYSAKFSDGEKGAIERKRIEQQLNLRDHTCPSLVQIFDGGEFNGRLFLLMGRAPGHELEKVLADVARDKIRSIIDQVARGVAFLRSKNICHRDIKAANVYLTEDASQVTLLDVSVTRNIYDPVGVGTDHDGQLPVVATARYSPPEYLFRLLDPGPELWHALDVYQLGALLHDLIMRKPLFDSEDKAASENRYRFAWLVSTVDPSLDAPDVDPDLIFLARRALDKNWKRRSAVTLDDFLIDRGAQKKRALQLLGLRAVESVSGSAGENAARLARIREATRTVEEYLVASLKTIGVTARHEILLGRNDFERALRLSWPTPPLWPAVGEVVYEVQLSLQQQGRFATEVGLSLKAGESSPSAHLSLPEIVDDADAEKRLSEAIQSALEELALRIATANTGTAHVTVEA